MLLKRTAKERPTAEEAVRPARDVDVDDLGVALLDIV